MSNGSTNAGTAPVPLTATDVTIRGTRFEFSKLPAMAGVEVLEEIRAGLKASVIAGALMEAESGSDGTKAVIEAALSLPPPVVRALRGKLFRSVRFSNAQTTSQTLAGAEDMAFAGLEPTHVYEVMLRALTVNFTDSWDAFRFPRGPAAAPSTTP